MSLNLPNNRQARAGVETGFPCHYHSVPSAVPGRFGADAQTGSHDGRFFGCNHLRLNQLGEINEACLGARKPPGRPLTFGSTDACNAC